MPRHTRHLAQGPTWSGAHERFKELSSFSCSELLQQGRSQAEFSSPVDKAKLPPFQMLLMICQTKAFPFISPFFSAFFGRKESISLLIFYNQPKRVVCLMTGQCSRFSKEKTYCWVTAPIVHCLCPEKPQKSLSGKWNLPHVLNHQGAGCNPGVGYLVLV